MIALDVDVDQFEEELRRDLEEEIGSLQSLALEVAWDAADYGKQIARREDILFKSRYIAGFVARLRGDGAMVLNLTPYAAVIEFGRRPGAPGPPFQPIYEWVQGKLGLSGQNAISAAWAIRNAIHKRGTRPRAVMARVAIALDDLWSAALRRRYAAR